MERLLFYLVFLLPFLTKRKLSQGPKISTLLKTNAPTTKYQEVPNNPIDTQLQIQRYMIRNVNLLMLDRNMAMASGVAATAASAAGQSQHHHQSSPSAVAAHLMSATGGAAACTTASLGERDMMTYMPARNSPDGVGNGGEQQQQQQATSAAASAAGQQQQQPQQQPQQQQAQHHELSLADDAALTAMSADLMDIFGEGEPMLSPPTATAGAGAVHMTEQQQQLLRPPPFASVKFPTAGAAAASNSNNNNVGMHNVSDSSCSGRSSSSGGNTQQFGAGAGAPQQQQQQQQQQQPQQTNGPTWKLPTGCSELAWRLHGGQQPQQHATHPGATSAASRAVPNNNSNMLHHHPAQAQQARAQTEAQTQAQAQAQAHTSIDPLFNFSPQLAVPQQVASSAASSMQQHLMGMTTNGGGGASAAAPPAQPTMPMAGTKRPRFDAFDNNRNQLVSEDETDRVKRRRDRNAREQQRSQQINSQISHLRDVLTEANVQFKPDKYSTLVGVADYIKSLQSRKALLDAEHSKLLDTIRKTSDAASIGPAGSAVGSSPSHSVVGSSVGSGPGSMGSKNNVAIVPNTVGPSTASSSCAGTSKSTNPDEELLVFVRGLDYKNIFSSCGIALGIAAVDGRLVDCNDEFVTLSGRTRGDLVGGSNGSGRKMSLFNLLGREGMEDVFRAMSRMLRSDPPGGEGGSSSADDSSPTASSLSNSSSSSPQERSKSGRLHHHGMHAPHHVSFADSAGQIIYQREGSGPSDHWSGVVVQRGSKKRRLRLNITLVRSTDGRPKFFNCALSPHEEG